MLVTNGADAETLAALRAAAESAGATVEVIAPAVGGVDISDGSRVPPASRSTARRLCCTTPSRSSPSPAARAPWPHARPRGTSSTDAVAHCKFIGYTSGAAVLFEAAGLPTDPASADDGFISLSEHPAAEFIARCRQLRHWDRELAPVR